MTSITRSISRSAPRVRVASGRTASPTISNACRAQDYAPRAFSRIRKCFGVTTTSYAESLCGDLSFVEFQCVSRGKILARVG